MKKLNRKTIIIIAVVALALIVCLALLLRKHPEENVTPQGSTIGSTATAATEPGSTEQAMTQPQATQESTPDETASEQETTAPSSGNVPDLPPVVTTAPTEVVSMMSLPYAIPGTDLVIERIAGFDGLYLENGTMQTIDGVSTILVKNTGEKDVEFAQITMKCDGEELHFEGSCIPSGEYMVIQEKNAVLYKDGRYTDCEGQVAESDRLEQSEDQIKITDNGDGSLTIENISDEKIPCVRVFYKFYMEEMNAYVGGITFTAKLTDLEAGAEQTVTASHYSAGFSRVVMVRTYDSVN